MTNGLLYRYRTFAKCISPITLAKRLMRFCHMEAGSTPIEFAIVLPVVVLFVLGIISFGVVIYESSDLQGALNDAARQGKTGFPDIKDPGTMGGGRWTSVHNNFLGQTKFLFNPAHLTFDATSYPDFSNASNDKGGTPHSVGGSGAVVVYTASYPYPSIPFVQYLFGKGNLMYAHVVVKNEVFQ